MTYICLLHITHAHFRIQLAMIYHTESDLLKLASLITGLEYGMEWWNGKWNETVNVHNYS